MAQWRQDFRVKYAEHVGRRFGDVFRASLTDADVPWDVRRRIEEAFEAQMLRLITEAGRDDAAG